MASQFPYPRKTSDPHLSARQSTYYARVRRGQSVKRIAIYAVAAVGTVWLLLMLLGRGSSSTPYMPPGTPKVVVVTTIDPTLSESHRQNIRDNRRDYASRHGYATFFPNTTDYDLMANVPSTWSTVPAIRHAMTLYPHTPWVFYLTSTALIMNPRISLDDRVLKPAKLRDLMIVDKPVVPPDSVIRTFSHLKPERVDFIISQDRDGLAGGSFLIKSGEWAKFFLDAWYDPLYRSYNFQKAEGHALEHIVQWHGTVLAKLALVPQRVLNSYAFQSDNVADSTGYYQEGDFVANFHGCHRDSNRDCDDEMRPLVTRWRELKDGERRR